LHHASPPHSFIFTGIDILVFEMQMHDPADFNNGFGRFLYAVPG